jgi:histidyl-tRNA synthetase
LRFDLTVPLARFAAQHAGELGLPFKRYHIATVLRGENTQRGRYREFMQCDFDTIGTRAVAADTETVLVIHDLFRAIGFEQFRIHLNNRMVLTGLLERLGLADRAPTILRALDKWAKIGADRVAAEMVESAALTDTQAADVVRLAAISGTSDEILRQIEPLVAGSATGQEGLARLSEVLAGAAAAGVPASRIKLDLSIARGLDYYTGLIFETYLDALPKIGSVCSGGRYDNLARLFTDQELPGIGGSLGLDRLLAAMEELGMLEKVATPAPVFIAYFDPQRLGDYLGLAAAIRGAGIGVEVFPEPKKLGQQLKYADRRGFRVAIVAGSNEFQSGSLQIKNLANGTQRTVPLEPDAQSVVAALKEIFGGI